MKSPERTRDKRYETAAITCLNRYSARPALTASRDPVCVIGAVAPVSPAAATGLGDEPATTVFRGLATGFVDARVTNGVRCEVRAQDAADNAASQATTGIPVAGGQLIAPRSGALVRPGRPPLLRWTPVRGARYYNLQLWRRGTNILSVWAARPHYRLKQRWRYGGRSWRLEPGRYRWLVWPGFGPRSKADYGRRIGPSWFRVGRARPR